MWTDLLLAISLLLVIEGILPFVSPKHWRNMMMALARHSDLSIRIMGLVSMFLGLVLMYLLHYGLIS